MFKRILAVGLVSCSALAEPQFQGDSSMAKTLEEASSGQPSPRRTASYSGRSPRGITTGLDSLASSETTARPTPPSTAQVLAGSRSWLETTFKVAFITRTLTVRPRSTITSTTTRRRPSLPSSTPTIPLTDRSSCWLETLPVTLPRGPSPPPDPPCLVYPPPWLLTD